MSNSETPTILYLVRHGQSNWNEQGLWQGQADTQLSGVGRRQAHSLGRRLARAGITHLYTSDLERSLETAQILGAHLGLAPVTHRGFRESDLGEWTGLTSSEIQSRYPLEWADMTAGREVRRGGGETYRELEMRTLAAAQELIARHSGERILVVSHGGAIRSLIGGALSLDLERLQGIGIGSNASLSRLHFQHGRYYLDKLNDTGHLDGSR